MKILHVTYGFNGGGVGSVIYNYCARRKVDGIDFDIVGEDMGQCQIMQPLFEEAGFHCLYVTPKGKKTFIKNIREMYALMKNGHYDAVHVHMEEWSAIYLMLAKMCGIPKRICHAHMAHAMYPWKYKFMGNLFTEADKKPHYALFRKMIRDYSTDRLACSKAAGDHLFGEGRYKILNNAIDARLYVFDEKKREEKRKELQVEGKFVVGTVGRLAHQKHPELTLDIFEKVHERKPGSVLIFAGNGDLEEKIKDLAKEKGLENDVLFLGYREDVPDLLQAMDVFLLPSRFEGLGIVYVEAQAAGLQSFGTKTLVPEEACITDSLMHYIPEDAGPDVWAAALLNCDYETRKDTSSLIREKGYDIDAEIDKLMDLYRS